MSYDDDDIEEIVERAMLELEQALTTAEIIDRPLIPWGQELF